MQKYLTRLAVITVGCALMGIAVNSFYVPNKLLSGGVGGISVILYYLTALPMGLTSILINIPLFALAYRFLDRSYLFTALYGMLVFSFSLDFFNFLSTMNIVHDTLLSCIAGGALNGIGCSLLYRVNGSSGGSDIIGAVINKYYSISIGTIGFIINLGLMLFAAFVFGIEPALYTLVAFFVNFKIANTFTDGFDYKKNFIIISERYEEISEAIIQVVGRGVTYLYAEGAYTHQQRKVLFVVAKLTQVAQIRAIVRKLDPGAFVIIHDAADVMGKGFTSKPDPKHQHQQIFPPVVTK
ncbi:MAG: YitT family protein [Acidaminococcaceae bacterium]